MLFCEGILRPWAEGWLNCPNLEVPENFKVSCSDTEENNIFAVKKMNP